MKNMKKNHFLFVIVLAIFSLSSCLKDDAQPTPQALVTLLNAYPNDAGVSYVVDGRQVTSSNGTWKGLTYFRAYPGNKKLDIYDKMSQQAILDTTMNYADSTMYTGFVYGTAGHPKFIRTTDLAVENLGDKAGIRFIHVGNGVGKVSFQLGDQSIPAFQNRAQESASTIAQSQIFHPATAGTLTLTVKDEQGNVLVTRDNIVLKNGYYYTFALMGTKGDTGKPLEVGYF